MANYLIKPIGGVDLEIEDKSKFSNISYYSEKGKTIKGVRFIGKKLLEQIKENESIIDYLSFKIIEEGIKFCEQKFNGEPFTLLYILTDNKKDPKNDDTLYIGEIFNIWQRNKYKIQFITLVEDLKSFDANYNELSKYFNNETEEIKFNFSDDKVIVHTAAGLPNTRIALMLHCIQRFKESNVCQIETFIEDKGLVTNEQSFPKQFRDNLRKNIFPHALKETLAIISAKNLSHTDGSHVMPWFESAFKNNVFEKDKIVEVFSTYNAYLKNTMELTADLSGGMGKQSFINYQFSDIADYLTNLFSTFLGQGVTDGKGKAIIEIDKQLNEKEVALPGGENGKTALLFILKNFFRNLYKHSNPDNENNYRGKLNLEESDSDEFFKITLTEESISYSKEDAENTVNKINGLIKEKILNDDMTVRETGWGIMEMKIAAAYLIGLPMELFESYLEIESGIYPLHFIEASATMKSDGNFQLTYTFYLLKPKIALVESNEEWKSQYHELPQGFDWLDGKDKNTVRTRHEFIIRKTNGAYDTKLKSSNIKQVFLDPFESLTDYLAEENKLHEKWVERLQEDISGVQNMQLFALDEISKNPVTESKNLCVFDDHGKWHKKKNPNLNLNDLGYYEKFNSYQLPRQLIVKNATDLYINKEREVKAKEVILTNIAILDERIQEYTENTIDENFSDPINPNIFNYKLHWLYGLKKIFIPQKLVNGNNEDIPFANWNINSFSGKSCSLNVLMYGKGKNITGSKFEFLIKMLEFYFVQKNCHYVVLHLSGFETIVNDSTEYLKSKIPGYTDATLDEAYWYLFEYEVLGKYIKNKSKYLIFTSGKGTPKTLPDNSYFVSLGNLELSLKKNKYELVKLLNSIRKIKK